MKNSIKIAFLALLGTLSALGMDAPLAPANQATVATTFSLKIEKGFGATFDFISLLKDTPDLNNATYKQRLTFVKRYLFDFILNQERPFGTSTERSGGFIQFIKNYCQSAFQLRESGNLIPKLHGQIVTRYKPERAINSNFIFQQNGLKFTYILAQPYFIIDDPDTESLALTLGQLRKSQNHSLEEKKNIVLKLNTAQNQTHQYKAVLNSFIFDFNGQYLDEMIEKEKQKDTDSPILGNRNSFNNFTLNCPLLLKLRILHSKLLKCPRNFLDNKNDVIIFTADAEKLFSELSVIEKQIDNISHEYTVLYQRIQQELKQTKKQNSSINAEIIEEPSETIELPKKSLIAQNDVQLPKIKYAGRVLRWFRDSFAMAQKKSSVLYHALLPLVADSTIISFGHKNIYNNKTHKGQKDNHYTIPGKLIDEANNQESFCVFRLCLDPKGICYHRECSKCDWEDLNPELLKACNFEEDTYIEEDEKVIESDRASIISETQFSTTINNPKFKHKIILYKKQF